MRKYVTEFTGTFGLVFTVSWAVKGSSRDASATVLTWHEHEIAELAAAGLTNKRIGEQLFLSHRTSARTCTGSS